MGKYELQCSIRNAENQIGDLKNQINGYARKITVYQKDYTKIAGMYEDMESGYKRKQEDVNLARIRARGMAITSYITQLDELYGYDKWKQAAQSFENIEEVIQDNIRQAQRKIEELQSQIGALENRISGWREEIRQIERQEKKTSLVRKAGKGVR